MTTRRNMAVSVGLVMTAARNLSGEPGLSGMGLVDPRGLAGAVGGLLELAELLEVGDERDDLAIGARRRRRCPSSPSRSRCPAAMALSRISSLVIAGIGHAEPALDGDLGRERGEVGLLRDKPGIGRHVRVRRSGRADRACGGSARRSDTSRLSRARSGPVRLLPHWNG